MIGVVIPVHNEEKYLHACLDSIETAACRIRKHGENVRIAVVLDNCSDESASIAAQFNVDILSIDANNVGITRHTGAEHLLKAGARWLACTDADTCVAADWLIEQIALQAEVVCGTVGVRHWQLHRKEVRKKFYHLYNDNEGHRHIHGANLGVCADSYKKSGGFPPLTVGEDVALIDTLRAMNANIAWSSKPRVFTSARRYARCRDGFSDYLLALDELVSEVAVCN